MPAITRIPWISMLAIVLLLVAGLAPVRAAGPDMIHVTKPTDLAFPAAQAPAGLVLQPSKNQALTDASLAPLIGKHMLGVFHQNGWATGYHGWLNAVNPQGAPFVTYDLYAFKSVDGARVARLAYQQLILGVQTPVQDPTLPKSAAVWTDGTPTFGPNNQPYAVGEIVFRVANVIGDVTGYYVGGDVDAINQALHVAILQTAASVRWLTTKLPPAHGTFIMPLMPLALLPQAFRRMRRRS